MSQHQAKNGSVSGVGLLHKMLQILDLFQPDSPGWSQVELVRATGLTKSTVNRLVRYLCERGYLISLQRRGRYTLGPAAIDLGRRATAQFDLREICQPTMEDLARATDETVLLTALTAAGNAVRCVDQIESTFGGLRVFEHIGATFPLHSGAAPKAVLSFLGEPERKRYVSQKMAASTPHTIVEPKTLLANLAEIRSRGYAISREETYEGVVGVAGPFFWSDRRPAGSIAVACPLHRASDEAIAGFGAQVIAAGREITTLLAGTDPREPTPRPAP
jgi:IclR family acetate operon transcriptional repressor